MAAIAKKLFYPLNSQYFEIDGLKNNSVTPATYLNAATASATLKDLNGAAVAGFTAVAGAYVAASNGVYQFAVDPVLFNPPIGTYVLFVTATQAGMTFEAEFPAKVVTRQTGLETTS